MNAPAASAPVNLRRLSVIAGRCRWDIPALLYQPGYAAAVSAVLEGCPGVRGAEANPRTGRLLVFHDPVVHLDDVERFVRSALQVPPLSPEAYVAWNEAREL